MRRNGVCCTPPPPVTIWHSSQLLNTFFILCWGSLLLVKGQSKQDEWWHSSFESCYSQNIESSEVNFLATIFCCDWKQKSVIGLLVHRLSPNHRSLPQNITHQFCWPGDECKYAVFNSLSLYLTHTQPHTQGFTWMLFCFVSSTLL